MACSGNFWGLLHRFNLAPLEDCSQAAFLVSLGFLRNSTYQADPLLDTYLEMAGSLIAFTSLQMRWCASEEPMIASL